MTHSSWKRRVAVSALLAAPLLAAAPVTALAQRPPPGAAAPDTKKATELFMKGTELYKAKKFGPALEAFKQSYAIVPSPNSHLYIARCLRDMGETRAAYLEFDKVYDEAAARAATEDKYVPTRDSARTERDEISGKVGLVNVTVRGGPPGTTLRIGPYDVPPDRWGHPYPVEPGGVDVIVQAPGQQPARQMVTVSAGRTASVMIEVGAAPPPVAGPVPHKKSGMSGMRIGAFVAGGIGVVGFAMFAGAGASSNGTYSDLETLCGKQAGCPGGSRAAADDLISKGKTQQAIANAGLGIGIVGIAAGVTLFALSTRKKGDDSKPATGLVITPSWAGVEGTF
jgi:hypothetical protein